MLTIGVLVEAYGSIIRQKIETNLDRKVSAGALQSALTRLEEKRYLTSLIHENQPSERGGKLKKYFRLTEEGKKELKQCFEIRSRMWNEISG